MNSKINYRITFVIVSFIILFIIIVIRLVNIQLIKHDILLERQNRQSTTQKNIKANRGRIYDRDGVILAEDIPSISVFALPKAILDLEKTSMELSRLTLIPKTEVHALLELNKDHDVIWIRRKMDISLEERIKTSKPLDRSWGYLIEAKRYYPEKEAASHVLGYTDFDNNGINGLESFFDNELKGKSGYEKYYIDALNRRINSMGFVDRKEPINGKDLQLTIGKDIQLDVENELKRYALKHNINEGTILIMKANSGEIYALANYPTGNPNNPSHSTAIYNAAIQEEIDANPLAFLILVSSGIERKALNLNSKLFRNRKIVDYFLAPEDISNELLMELISYLGESLAVEYLNFFEIGQKTEISLPNEESGYLNLLEIKSQNRWMLATPIQIAKAIGSITSDGISLNPTIVNGNYSPKKFNKESASPFKKVILKGTASELKKLLNQIAANINVKLEGYDTGGLGYKFTSKQKKEGAIFVGYLDESFSKERIIILSMVTLLPNASKSVMKITRDLFRDVSYDTLRYFESKEAEKYFQIRSTY